MNDTIVYNPTVVTNPGDIEEPGGITLPGNNNPQTGGNTEPNTDPSQGCFTIDSWDIGRPNNSSSVPNSIGPDLIGQTIPTGTITDSTFLLVLNSDNILA